VGPRWEQPILVAAVVAAVIWGSASLAASRPGAPVGPEPRQVLPVVMGTPTPSPWPPPTSKPGPNVVVPWRLLDPRYDTIPVENLPSGRVARFAAVYAQLHGNVVTLTAVGRDVSLDPCPDFNLVSNGSRERRYGLDCAGVPFRDDAKAPYLPAGQPVSFVIGLAFDAWELAAPDGVRVELS
jgi:hypothetical protein